jgi:hypothetical protein
MAKMKSDEEFALQMVFCLDCGVCLTLIKIELQKQMCLNECLKERNKMKLPHYRLVTGGRDGILKIWNFNNGQCLKILKKGEYILINISQYKGGVSSITVFRILAFSLLYAT